MNNVIDFKKAARRVANTQIGARDPEKAEVFPGVSLADLWRLWARSEEAKRRDAGADAQAGMIAG